MYNKKVVEHLEKNCFYKNNEILLRESDKDIIRIFQENNFNNILDYGSGTGRMYELLKNSGVNLANYTGFDSSADMVEYAKKKFKDVNFSNNVSGYYDVVLCSGVLQHQQKEELNSFISNVSGLGNKIVFQFWYANKEKFKFAEIENSLIPEYFPTKDIIENELFENYEIEYIKYFQDHPYDLCVLVINGKSVNSEEKDPALTPEPEAEKKTTVKKTTKKATQAKKSTKDK